MNFYKFSWISLMILEYIFSWQYTGSGPGLLANWYGVSDTSIENPVDCTSTYKQFTTSKII